MIRIEDKARCCGCGACAAICPAGCIEMLPDAAGSDYPQVDEAACVGCGLCEEACPVLHVAPDEPRPQRAFLAQNLDEGVLAESTSGGAFSALACEVIARGGVVFGAGYEPARQQDGPLVSHFGVEDEDGLALFRNSKYVQSECGGCFPQVAAELKAGRWVLFSGTPCQAEGLKRFLRSDPPRLIVADVVCRAAPRRSVFDAYLSWVGERYGRRPAQVRFRDKRRFGYRYSQICAFGEGEEEPFYTAGVESDPFLRSFFGNYADREICYACPFKKRHRESDVTMWDCFDVREFDKSLDNNRGVTRLLVQSEKGQALIDAAAPRMRLVEIDADEACEGVREMFHSVPRPERWGEFAADVATLPGAEVMGKWFPDTPRVKAERTARLVCERLGIYDPMKRAVKKVLGK